MKTLPTKTYSAISSVHRAAKAAGFDKAEYIVINQEGAYACVAVIKDSASEMQEEHDLEENRILGEDLGMSTVRCPSCHRTELYVGENIKGLVVNEDSVIGCHNCGWEHKAPVQEKPAKKPAKQIPQTHKSDAEKPCKLTWDIAEKMIAENPAAKRKDIIESCVEAGVAFYTARTQYQQWFTAKKATPTK